MAEELEKVGLFIDEFDKIRIIDPAVYTQTNDLKENYKVFDDSKLYQCLYDLFKYLQTS